MLLGFLGCFSPASPIDRNSYCFPYSGKGSFSVLPEGTSCPDGGGINSKIDLGSYCFHIVRIKELTPDVASSEIRGKISKAGRDFCEAGN